MPLRIELRGFAREQGLRAMKRKDAYQNKIVAQVIPMMVPVCLVRALKVDGGNERIRGLADHVDVAAF